MVVIFDLDYTLLDTKRFKKDLALCLGLSEIEFDLIYRNNYRKAYKNFEINSFLKSLDADSRLNLPRIRKDVENLLKNINSYLFPKAEELISYFKNRGDTVILVTFGNSVWQKEKIEYLEIKKYFDQIIFENTDKSMNPVLNTIITSDEKVLLINDNAKESLKLSKITQKNLEVVLIKGPYSNNAINNFTTYESISEYLNSLS